MSINANEAVERELENVGYQTALNDMAYFITDNPQESAMAVLAALSDGLKLRWFNLEDQVSRMPKEGRDQYYRGIITG